MKKAENIPDSTATTVAALKDNFNALLAALKAAGYMEADPEEDPEEDDGDDGEDDDDDDSDENGGGENNGSEDPGGGES